MSNMSPFQNLKVSSRSSRSTAHRLIARTAREDLGQGTEKQEPKPKQKGSKWVIGWKTPFVMVAAYVFALLIFIAHLSMMLFLNGRSTGKHPQSLVTTASTLLAAAFRFSLQIALGTAFTQHLWRVLRVSAMRVDVVERLFIMRTNPFAAMRWAAVRTAPSLCAVVLIMWFIHVATAFPPGALIVIVSYNYTTELVQALTVDTGFIGNGSLEIVSAMSLARIFITSNYVNDTGTLDLSHDINNPGIAAIVRSASSTMIGGTIHTLPSPCGKDCWYILEFKGPYLSCTSNVVNETRSLSDSLPTYTGEWTSQGNYNTAYSLHNFAFNATVVKFIGAKSDRSSVIVEIQSTICRPSQADYNVNVTYQNGAQSFSVSIMPTGIIQPLQTSLTMFTCMQDNCTCINDLSCFKSPLNWNEEAQQWVYDTNNIAIIQSMIQNLEGANYVGYWYNPNSPGIPFTVNGTQEILYPMSTSDRSLIRTIISETRLNPNLQQYDLNDEDTVELNITEANLNELLQNVTLSLMNNFALWNTTVNATRWDSVNVYDFSSRLNLILPYSLSLLLSLPLLVLGGISLCRNGVSAIDGGFLQVLMTTASSEKLRAAAVGGCLGGPENIPEELQSMEIQFGELAGGVGAKHRAGFEGPNEVEELRKCIIYGSNS